MQAKFDEDHALVLVQVHNFRAGILYLYEKLKLYVIGRSLKNVRQEMIGNYSLIFRYNEIIQYHMEHKEYDQITKSCKKFG